MRSRHDAQIDDAVGAGYGGVVARCTRERALQVSFFPAFPLVFCVLVFLAFPSVFPPFLPVWFLAFPPFPLFSFSFRSFYVSFSLSSSWWLCVLFLPLASLNVRLPGLSSAVRLLGCPCDKKNGAAVALWADCEFVYVCVPCDVRHSSPSVLLGVCV